MKGSVSHTTPTSWESEKKRKRRKEGRKGKRKKLRGFRGGSAGKESTWNAGDLGSIPGLGRFPGEGKGYPLQYSGLENSIDCIVHGVTKSWTQPVPSLHDKQMGKQWKQWQTLFWGAPKSLQVVTADMKLKDACSLAEKLDSVLKSRDITLPTKVHVVKAVVFPVVMYGCESWM